MNLDIIDKIASIISSLSILIGSIIIAFTFRYKHDSEIRNLYLNNYKSINDVLIKIFKEGTVNIEDLGTISNAKNNAQVYLHNEVFELIEEIYIKMPVN